MRHTTIPKNDVCKELVVEADSEAGVCTKINVMTRLFGISHFNAFKKQMVISLGDLWCLCWIGIVCIKAN